MIGGRYDPSVDAQPNQLLRRLEDRVLIKNLAKKSDKVVFGVLGFLNHDFLRLFLSRKLALR